MGPVTGIVPGRPEPLRADHELDAFDCGIVVLNEWLKRRTRANEASGVSRTFVACAGGRVAGYCSLAAASLLHGTATSRVRRNMPDPVPAILLGRLAVDRNWQGVGLGADLLSDAVRRIVGAAEIIGVRAILVHALSDQARAFYEHHGFRSSPIDPLTLMVTVEEAGRMIG